MKKYIDENCRFALCFGILMIAGCASTGPAPVVNRSVEVRAHAPRNGEERTRNASASGYRVERGDTLYSIAFRNGLDYRDLAQWNGIGSPYTIYVGQTLRLSPERREPDRVVAAAGRVTAARL
ncbi:MAG: LysM peptidoglycan-binding domain-containing protein, partial [Rhodanobacteraceae bacterium]